MFAGSRFTILAVEIFILLDVVRSETDAEEMKPQLTLVTLDPVNLNISNDGKCCDATDFDQFVVHNILDV